LRKKELVLSEDQGGIGVFEIPYTSQRSGSLQYSAAVPIALGLMAGGVLGGQRELES
jgi:hypothetical protein